MKTSHLVLLAAVSLSGCRDSPTDLRPGNGLTVPERSRLFFPGAGFVRFEIPGTIRLDTDESVEVVTCGDAMMFGIEAAVAPDTRTIVYASFCEQLFIGSQILHGPLTQAVVFEGLIKIGAGGIQLDELEPPLRVRLGRAEGELHSNEFLFRPLH